MNIKNNSLIVAAILLSTSACSYDRRAVVSEQQVSLFEKEIDAAYESALNKDPVRPLTTLSKGQEVIVLKDIYGKDYWACKVKLGNNTTGWVLCTSLEFKERS